MIDETVVYVCKVCKKTFECPKSDPAELPDICQDCPADPEMTLEETIAANYHPEFPLD